MNRLFIHLFVVIIVALLSINWLSEYIWQQWRPAQTSEYRILAQTLTALTKQNSPNQKQLKRIEQHLTFPVKIIQLADVAWLESQKKRLKENKHIIGYDNNDNIVIYIPDINGHNIYAFGPIKQHSESNNIHSIKYTLLFFSYLLLTLIIYLWSRPLWQDLNQLNSMANQISRGEFNIKPLANKHSPIGNIVSTFNLMAQRIIRLISDQKQLVNDVSHELRTPLARLRFSIEMLNNVPVEQRLEMTQDISEMSLLIDEMLSYARLENVNIDTCKTDTDLVILINNAIAKFGRNSTVAIDCDLPLNCTFSCNEQMLERAIQNLLTNALRYAKEKVQIQLSNTEQQLVIYVDDDGDGIEDIEKHKVFDAFYRIEKSRNKELGGFGLGLAIVSRICQWHNGHCKLTDSPLGGCRFAIIIPK